MGHKNQDLWTKINFQLCEFNCWHSSKSVKISFSKLIVYFKNDLNLYGFFQLRIRNSLGVVYHIKTSPIFDEVTIYGFKKYIVFFKVHSMLIFGQISYFLGPRQPIIRKVNIHKSHLAVRSGKKVHVKKLVLNDTKLVLNEPTVFK